jgi:hypothetical protein
VFSVHDGGAGESIRHAGHLSGCNDWDNMRATGTFRAQKPSTGVFSRDVWRAFLACGFVLTLCVVAAVIGSWSQSPPPQLRTTSEVDLSTGSMLVVSPTGNLCRERTINNANWQIRDKGLVDCAEALAKASGVEARSTSSRLDIIRESFRGKP